MEDHGRGGGDGFKKDDSGKSVGLFQCISFTLQGILVNIRKPLAAACKVIARHIKCAFAAETIHLKTWASSNVNIRKPLAAACKVNARHLNARLPRTLPLKTWASSFTLAGIHVNIRKPLAAACKVIARHIKCPFAAQTNTFKNVGLFQCIFYAGGHPCKYSQTIGRSVQGHLQLLDI